MGFRQAIASELTEVLQDQQHALVIGSPGSGKSTLVAYLATRAAARQLRLASQSPLPLVVIVRALKNPALTARSLAEHTGCEADLVERALQREEAILLIDGLDEAPSNLRQRLIESLQRFLRSNPKVHVVVTSRPAGAPGEVEGQIEGLRSFRLLDLTREEVYRLIERWYLAAEKSLLSDHKQAEREATKAVAGRAVRRAFLRLSFFG